MCLGFKIERQKEATFQRDFVTSNGNHHLSSLGTTTTTTSSSSMDVNDVRDQEIEAKFFFCVYVNGKRCALRDGIGETTALEFLRGTTPT